MGAECIISGIRPQIAQTIVTLGVDLQVVSKQQWRTRSSSRCAMSAEAFTSSSGFGRGNASTGIHIWGASR